MHDLIADIVRKEMQTGGIVVHIFRDTNINLRQGKLFVSQDAGASRLRTCREFRDIEMVSKRTNSSCRLSLLFAYSPPVLYRGETLISRGSIEHTVVVVVVLNKKKKKEIIDSDSSPRCQFIERVWQHAISVLVSRPIAPNTNYRASSLSVSRERLCSVITHRSIDKSN